MSPGEKSAKVFSAGLILLAGITQFEQFTAALDLITPDLDVARHYATIRSRLRSRGELIPDNDTWIAATALAHNLTLVSRDAHFSRIPDLKLYLPS